MLCKGVVEGYFKTDAQQIGLLPDGSPTYLATRSKQRLVKERFMSMLIAKASISTVSLDQRVRSEADLSGYFVEIRPSDYAF